MIKLLYITNQISGSGGLERVLSIKASLLAEDYNYEVHIITLNQDEDSLFYDFSEKLIYHNIKASGNKLKSFIQYRKGLRKKVSEINPDIISVCDDGLKGFFVPLFISKPCPMVYERHVSKNIENKKDNLNVFEKLKQKITYFLMDLAAKRYDTFVVLTQGNRAEWNLKNLKVISNPLSFYPEENSTLLNKKIVAVGKQSFQKGYDRLLKSWQLVQKSHPDWTLEVYGKLEPLLNLENMAVSLGLAKSVFFYPPTKNIQEKYKSSSIYVLSSRYEGFGMVLIEAMAYGVPCVSFNCPHGPSDIITDKEDGFLVSNGDIEALANKINTLIENEDLRQRMGKAAKTNVQRYLPAAIIPQWNDLFLQLLKPNIR